jgi:Fur family transcriptional regulator, ferric uptake regulator
MMFQRNTRQRHAILEELRALSSHPTAAELYEIARRRLPNLSLGTVYRNLDLLARMGTIQKLEWSAGETRFDGEARPHDHLRCIRCGRVDDVGTPPLRLERQGGEDFRGYQILGHRLEYLGICPNCKTLTTQGATNVIEVQSTGRAEPAT